MLPPGILTLDFIASKGSLDLSLVGVLLSKFMTYVPISLILALLIAVILTSLML